VEFGAVAAGRRGLDGVVEVAWVMGERLRGYKLMIDTFMNNLH
jgi:hypothetical protein